MSNDKFHLSDSFPEYLSDYCCSYDRLRNAPESLDERSTEESPNILSDGKSVAQREHDKKLEISYVSSVSDAEQANIDSANTKVAQLQPTSSEDDAGIFHTQNTQHRNIDEQITIHGNPEPERFATIGNNLTPESMEICDEASNNPITDQFEKVSIEDANRCISCLAKLETPIIELPGIGPKSEEAFHKLGLYSLRDLLWHFPRYFIDRSKLCRNIREVPNGDIGTFLVKINANRARYNTVSCTDEAGNYFTVTFFYGQSRQGRMAASAASENLFKMCEAPVIVSGKVKHSDKGAEIFNPDHVVSRDEAEKVLGIDPVYGTLFLFFLVFNTLYSSCHVL